MPSWEEDPESPTSLGRRLGRSYDTRSDLGYGVSKEKHHKPRSKAGSFPYDEPLDDECLDLDITDDNLKKINNKISTPFKSSDFLIGRSADHVAFANGNHPIALGEVSGKSLVPFPGMYKKRIQVGGGVNSPKLIAPGQYNRTGTYRGWSHAPIPADDSIGSIDGSSTNDKGLEKIKALVKMILSANSKDV